MYKPESHINTPYGVFETPSFIINKIKLCKTEDDLFKLAMPNSNGDINPHIFNEICKKRLYYKYLDWLKFNALEYLNALIEQGIEYPDAIYQASEQYKVNHDDLQAEYDNQFGGQA